MQGTTTTEGNEDRNYFVVPGHMSPLGGWEPYLHYRTAPDSQKRAAYAPIKGARDVSGSYHDAATTDLGSLVMIHGARKSFPGKTQWADSHAGKSVCSRSDARSSP